MSIDDQTVEVHEEVQNILDGISEEIKELQAYANKFRGNQATTDELQEDINNLTRQYHIVSEKGDLYGK